MSRGFLYFAVLLLVAICSIEQVSAVKCYQCDSNTDKDCESAAHQDKFAVECTKHSFVPSLGKLTSNEPTGVEYDCAYGKGVSTDDANKTIVRRGCAVKTTTCETYKRMFKADHNIELEKCNHCADDLCNSSGHLSTGIWIISLSLITLYFLKA